MEPLVTRTDAERAASDRSRPLTRIGDLTSIGLSTDFVERLAEMVGTSVDQPLTEFQAATLGEPAIQAHDCNLLIAGPTSAGKTLIASVLAALVRQSNPRKKIVYAVPLRALVTEKAREWERLFAGARTLPVSSDYPRSDHFLRLGKWDVAVVVFEKLYQWLGEAEMAKRIVPQLGLVIFDELQVIGELGRGEKLEIAATLLRHYQKQQRSLPFVIAGMGASREVADGFVAWLDARVVPTMPVSRPIPLYEAVIQRKERRWTVQDELTRRPLSTQEIPPAIAGLFERALASWQLVVRAVERGYRVMIYTASRRSAVQKAHGLTARFPSQTIHPSMARALDDLEDSPIVDELRAMLRARVGVHHGHMSALERRIVEEGFRSHEADAPIAVLVATRTLAMGVNLPADLVVIDDLHTGIHGDALSRSFVRKLTVGEYRNLAGRAGRLRSGLPPDAFGLVVVYDKHGEWEGVAQQLLEGVVDPIESSLAQPQVGWGPHAVTALAFQQAFERAGTTPEHVDAVLKDSYLSCSADSSAVGLALEQAREGLSTDLNLLGTLGICSAEGLTGAGNAISKFGLSTAAIAKLIAIASDFDRWWPHRRLALLDELFDTPELFRFLRPHRMAGPKGDQAARARAREVSWYALRYVDIDELIPESPQAKWLARGPGGRPASVDIDRFTKAIALRQWSDGVEVRPLAEFWTHTLQQQLRHQEGHAKRRRMAAFFYLTLGQLSDAAEMMTTHLAALRQVVEQIDLDRDHDELQTRLRRLWIWEQSVRFGIAARQVALPVIVAYATNEKLRRRTVGELYTAMGNPSDPREWQGRPAPPGIKPAVWELVQAGFQWWSTEASSWNTGERYATGLHEVLELSVTPAPDPSTSGVTAGAIGDPLLHSRADLGSNEDGRGTPSSLRSRTLMALEQEAEVRIATIRANRDRLLSLLLQTITSAPLVGLKRATMAWQDQRLPVWIVEFKDGVVPIAVWSGDLSAADLQRELHLSDRERRIHNPGPAALIVAGAIADDVAGVPASFRAIVRASSLMAVCRWAQHRPADLAVARSLFVRTSEPVRRASDAFRGRPTESGEPQ